MTQVSFEQFKALDLRIGRVIEAGPHPNADRLLLLQVDIGEEAPRQVVAGIRSSYAPEDLVGKRLVLLTNLEPAVLRGVESQAMLLAASDEGRVMVLTPDGDARPGSRVG